MTNKVIIVFTIIFAFFSASAQTLKTYNGVFKTNTFSGIASYQYFDNSEGERTFTGNFKFQTVNNTVSISGRYQNNLKTGLWRSSLTNYSYSDPIFIYNINSISTGNYSNGKLSGMWNLHREKIISYSKHSFVNQSINSLSFLFEGKNIDFSKKRIIDENSSATFLENHFVGGFIYSVNNGKSKVTGEFDKDGYMQGLWIAKYFLNGIPIEEKRTYLNGVLINTKLKDLSTGEITIQYDNEEEVRAFFQNYNKDANSSYFKDSFYALSNEKENRDGSLIEQSLSIWINSISIAESSYAFEVKQGGIMMDGYPQRTIVVDNDKNDKKHDQELEQERIDEEKKRKIEDEQRQVQNEAHKFERSDYGQLKKRIKTKYESWAAKSDFEPESDYQKRISEQASDKLQSIVLEETSNKIEINVSAVLSSYDAESENFIVLANFGNDGESSKPDTFLVKIPRIIAPTIYSSIKNKQDEHNRTSIMVIPSKIVMVHNKWTIADAKIVFCVRCDCSCIHNYSSYEFKVISEANKIYAICEGAPKGYDNKEFTYEIKNFKDYQAGDNNAYRLYYTNWQLNIQGDNSLVFNFETLGISKFNTK